MTTSKKFDFSQMVATSSDLGNMRKSNNFYKATHLVALVDDEIKDLAEIRYYGTGKINTAILWMHSTILGLYGSAAGKAGGYGYNREEAARSQAIEGFGITVPSWCDEREFFEALADHLGVKVYSIVSSYA